MYSNKFDNLDGIDKFLERCNFLKLTQEDIALHLILKSAFVVKNLFTNKTSAQMASLINSIKFFSSGFIEL